MRGVKEEVIEFNIFILKRTLKTGWKSNVILCREKMQ